MSAVKDNHVAASSDLEKYKTTVILRDGSTLYLRPIQREDEERLLALFSRLSPRAIYLRFHHVLKQLPKQEARRLCTVDYENAFALVATVGEGVEERIVAVGRYYRLPRRDAAELALVVEDAYQGKGIGTHLLRQLASIAGEKGIRLFEAEVLAENQQIMRVLKDSGFHVAEELERGLCRVILSIAPTLVLEERPLEREKVAGTEP
jgi:RimJ/RimL family protein N-acetyltransferase